MRSLGSTKQPALLADTIDGYIRACYIVDADGLILATITADRDALGYGPFSRRYIRATSDGVTYAGSCASDSTHLLLRRVKG